MLYACGSNGNGQLGLSHFEDVNEWQLVDIDLKGPIALCGGGNHTVIIEQNTGNAYMTDNAKFKKISHPEGQQWKLASAGWAFVILVDQNDCLWSLSSNEKFHTGLDPLRDSASLSKIDYTFPDEIVKIKSGMNHTVLQLRGGDVYGWGASRRGQCGQEARILELPTLVTSPKKIDDFACGRDFTICLLENGNIELWGDSRRFGDLGSRPADTNKPVIAGWSNFMVGSTIFGNTAHNGIQPPDIPGLTSFALGSEHILWVEDGGTVKTSGWGEHGNCPPPSSFSGKVTVFGGCATSFVYTESQ